MNQQKNEVITKIIFNDKKIYIADSYDQFQAAYPSKHFFVFSQLDVQKAETITDLLLMSEAGHALVVGEKEEVLEIFRKAFVHIKAAGGFVLNPDNDILFIFRRKHGIYRKVS
jgi:hypothetical protein